MNPILQDINVGMIQKFQIKENFQQGFPRSHMCKFVLYDGRKVEEKLIGPEIYIMIQAIAKEKIMFKRAKEDRESTWDLQTIRIFDTYKDLPYTSFKLNCTETPSADALLSGLFK